MKKEDSTISYSEYMTMREIAKLFGSTSHQIGRALKRLGLREENGEPSPRAHQLGLVHKRPVYEKECFDVWTWHVEKTIPFLEADGLNGNHLDHGYVVDALRLSKASSVDVPASAKRNAVGKPTGAGIAGKSNHMEDEENIFRILGGE